MSTEFIKPKKYDTSWSLPDDLAMALQNFQYQFVDLAIKPYAERLAAAEELLREAHAFIAEPAGMSEAAMRNKEMFKAFLNTVESDKERLVARISTFLSGKTNEGSDR